MYNVGGCNRLVLYHIIIGYFATNKTGTRTCITHECVCIFYMASRLVCQLVTEKTILKTNKVKPSNKEVYNCNSTFYGVHNVNSANSVLSSQEL